MKDIFTENDFIVAKNTYNCVTWVPPFLAAQVANNKLKEWLEREGVVVYGYGDLVANNELFGRRIIPAEASHKAILVCIEELKKKECEHRPKIHHVNAFLIAYEPICELCDERLHPTGWKTK